MKKIHEFFCIELWSHLDSPGCSVLLLGTLLNRLLIMNALLVCFQHYVAVCQILSFEFVT